MIHNLRTVVHLIKLSAVTVQWKFFWSLFSFC